MARTTIVRVVAALALATAAVTPVATRAQQQPPLVRGLVSGYGSVSYAATPDDDFASDFMANLSPLLLHQIGDNLLFEAELDIELADHDTDVHLEHAQVHWLGSEHLQLTAGMFHLPFGIWMHSGWVNRMPTPPLIYQDTHGAPAHDGLLPIMFDVGVMAKATFPLIDGWRTTADLWISQGPSDEIPPHTHAAEEPDVGPEPDATPLGYGANFGDNNSDKMVGLRLRAVSAGGITLQGSAYRAKYDAAGDLGVYGANVSAIWAPDWHGSRLFDLRGEGVLLGQDYAGDLGIESVSSGGYYVQLSHRVGSVEPIVRWSQLPQAIAGAGPLVEERRQLAIGFDYWLLPSVPIKAAYNIELDGTDGIFLEWAMGF